MAGQWRRIIGVVLVVCGVLGITLDLSGAASRSATGARGTPPATATAKPVPAAAPTALIPHYYQSILGRAPDPGGRAYWEDEIGRMQYLAIDIQEAYRVMAGWFLASPEYVGKKPSDAQFVTDLYNAFFTRAPDPGGLSFWLGQIAADMPRNVVLYSFLFSPEFATYMQTTVGSSASRGEVYAVVDFYRGLLNRLPDSDGFDYWFRRFRAAQCQGTEVAAKAAAVNAEVEAISSFFVSLREYSDRNRNNKQYVEDMYYAFLRRGGDLAGFKFWVSELDNKRRTRDQVRQWFLKSPEFQGRVKQIVDAGCLQPPANRPPQAVAGTDQVVTLPAATALAGKAFDDGLPKPPGAVTFAWSKISGPGSVAFGSAASAGTSATFSAPGAYLLRLTASDGQLTGSDDLQITVNAAPPGNRAPQVNAGAPQTITLPANSVTLSGTVTDDGLPNPPGAVALAWTKDSGPGTVTFGNAGAASTAATFSAAGSYVLRLTANDGQLSNFATIAITVNAAAPTNQAPQVNAGPDRVVTYPAAASLSGSATDDGLPNPPAAVNVIWSQVGGPGTATFADATRAVTTATFSVAGTYQLRLSAGDGSLSASDEMQVTVNAGTGGGGGLPPDPATVAPPVNPSVTTTVDRAAAFLYTGANPIQTGVAPGTIDAKRAAVLRGRVLDKNNAPLSGVTVTIHQHPEFGQTLSRADGRFDMAVNGGGSLTVAYARGGHLPAQRQVNVPWQDYVVLDDVVLIPRDGKVTQINLAATTVQAAQGSVVTDASGSRQPALLIPPGTQASRVMPGGGTQPLSALSLRFSEYTVGPNGPRTMPAELPPTSGYTYAVEISADEAPTKLNGQDVVFDRPVPFYVDNFINLPVGGEVPVGYYDNTKGAWISSENGRVIKILGVSGGLAQLDVSGSGTPADAGALAALGITDAEREKLAGLYPVGRSLWRMQITHLSTKDCNLSVRTPADAIAAFLNAILDWFKLLLDNPNCATGSTIECENQTLGERIPLVGTGLGLNYRSDRVQGRTSSKTIAIALSGPTLPASLKRIDLTVDVAGRRLYQQSYPAQPNQTVNVTWDGLDAYNRTLGGAQNATITISYAYDAVYQQPVRGRGFAVPSGVALTGNPTRTEVYLSRSYRTKVGIAPDFRRVGIGGWSLDVHHVYDPIGQVLYQGDGSRRSSMNLNYNVITTFAGGGDCGSLGCGDGGPAVQARLHGPMGLAVTSDGAVVFADSLNWRIRRISPEGIITTIAGNGVRGFSGDGGPATQASLNTPKGVAIGADGSILIADHDNQRIRRVGPNGIINTIAGNGNLLGDGGPAIQARLASPTGVAVSIDSSVLIADSLNSRIRRIGPDGIITTIAGIGQSGYAGDGGPATQALIGIPKDVSLASDGSVIIADSDLVRRIRPDGIITTIAGGGTCLGDACGDGGAATQAKMSSLSVAVTANGSILIGDSSRRLRHVGTDGIITTIAGDGKVVFQGFNGDGGPATQARLSFPIGGVAVSPDGDIFISDSGNNRIRKVSSTIPGFSATDLAIASSDGRLLYRFNPEGRHLSTVDTLTKTVLYSFGYDSAGRLTSITDADNNVTTIERNASGNPTAIVAPFGQRTTLTVNANGYLASVANPAGETHQLAYTADGLLTAFTDPRGNASQFTYDALGRLQRDANAAGGSQNLARAELADGYTVNRRTALNRTTAYTVEDLPIGDRQRKVRAPDGTETLTLLGSNGSAKITAPDGTVTESLDGPDPRFGMQSPITSSSTVTTGGLTATASSASTVTPANPTDPLTFTSLTRTATLNGRTATSTYTASTRRTDSRSPANRQSYSILDTKGRVIETGITGIDPVRMSYDTRGRLASVAQGTGANERVTSFAYNAAGYLASATDPLGQSGALSYDPAGRVQTQTLANGQQIDFDYDANGNLTSLAPPGKPAHGFAYNAVNRATAYTPPAVTGSGATSTLYAYNADKQVTRITRPDGGVLDYGYDAAGRLGTLSVPAGQYGYRYTATGKLDGITAPGGVALDYGYNGALMTGVTWSGPLAGSVGYGYDTDFRVNAITVNGANPVTYQYDADSLLTRASFGASNLNLTRSSQNGLLTGTTLGNANEAYTYNSFGEVGSYTGRYSSTNLLAFTYTRDKLGRITQKAETIQGATTTCNYAYDAIGQLIEVRQNGSIAATYGYDANGNRLSKTGPGINETGNYDAQDRMLSYAGATYSYTANGELQSKVQGGQTTSYNYDALGNLRQVTLPNGTQIEYLIDGQNRRIGKKVNNVLVQGFLYQGQLQPVAELDGSGNVVSRFVYAIGVNVPDYLIKGGQTYRILKDHLGSPRLVVDIATGTIAQRMDFDEYGKVLADSNPGFQPFGFAGGIYDRDTGLVRFGARDYEAGSGRWMAKDTIWFIIGNSNLYQYALNNPINFVDLDGLCPKANDSSTDSYFGIDLMRDPIKIYSIYSWGNAIRLAISGSPQNLARKVVTELIKVLIVNKIKLWRWEKKYHTNLACIDGGVCSAVTNPPTGPYDPPIGPLPDLSNFPAISLPSGWILPNGYLEPRRDPWFLGPVQPLPSSPYPGTAD